MKIKNTISFQLVSVISLTVTLIGSIFFTVYYFSSSDKSDTFFKNKISQQTDYLASSLVDNIWNYDFESVKRILKVVNINSEVVSIHLEADGFEYNLSEKYNNEKEHYYQLVERDIIAKRDITGEKESKIGLLKIVYTNEDIISNNNEALKSISLILFLIIIIIAFILKITLNRFLKRPFDFFASGFQKIAKGDYEYVKSMKGTNEIKGEFRPLLKSLSTMSNEIQIQMKQRESAEEKLRVAGNALEEKVVERTKSLQVAQTQLLKSSRQAGMAEVATNVIHNVGNALNSINISSEINYEKLKGLRLPVLKKVVDLLEENKDNAADFIANDPKGKMIPEIIKEILAYLTIERDELIKETGNIKDDIAHVQNIINMQQSYAKNILVEELQSPNKILEDAIRMNKNALKRHNIEITVEAEQIPKIKFDKHKVLQILLNLISNAKYSFFNTDQDKNLIFCSIKKRDDKNLEFIIKDNGCGIKKENLEQIYNYGFTTRKEGHGFGLHNSANTAKQLGGELSVFSDGEGKGAEFTLKVPVIE